MGHTISVPGYSILTGTNIPNVGGMFVILNPFEERAGHPELSAEPGRRPAAASNIREIQEAQAVLFGAPPIDGLGSTGGFKMQVQDRSGAGLEALQGAVANVAGKGNSQPGLVGLFSSFSANQPQLYVDVDRVKAKKQGVALNDVFETLQVYLGSAYVNDITLFNRNWQVNVQADARYRLRAEDVGKLQVRNADGEMVPLETMITVRDVTGPAIVNHYNSKPSAEITGNTAPGVSSGQAIALMDQICPAGAAGRHGLRVDGADLPADRGGQGPLDQAGLPAGGGVRLPGAGGAVRELVAAAGDHPDRADVLARRHRRRLAGAAWTTTSSRRSAWWCWSAWRARTPS